MNASDSIVIQTEGLTKTFKDVNALTQLNLSVHKNSIFGFLGPNGAGKTTTIKLLLGLSRPTSGGGTIFGEDIIRNSGAIRQRVGYLAQDPRYYEYMTARQTLRFTARFFYYGPKAAIEDRIQNTLELVGLADKADRPIKGFSGGEQQRLGIAQAQVNYPDLLILDEPAASLDPQGRRDVLEVMERLQKYTTIFYSTHILSDVQRVSDTVAILNKGRLVAEAPIEQLLAGSDGIAYTIVVQGDSERARQHIADQPWVKSVSTAANNGLTTWNVSVNDDQIAAQQLLRVALSDENLVVTEFGRKKHDLEEVFLNIVEGSNHVRV